MSTSIHADLHLHSTASDGEYQPAELVRRAAHCGLKAMALTDHDTMDGVAEALAEGERAGIEVVPGCELSAYLGDEELHILGLFLDPKRSQAVDELLEGVRAERPGRLLQMGARLRAIGVAISDDELRAAAARAKSPARTHVATALLNKGLVSSVNEAFKKYLNPGAPAYVEKVRLSPEQVIRAIHASGGIAILAHPGHHSGKPELLKSLITVMDGFEALHSSHSMEQRVLFQAMASDAGKLVSGGSDFHGPKTKPGVLVGCSGVSKEQFERLRPRSKA